MRAPLWCVALGLLGLGVPAAAEVQQVTIAAGGVLWLSCTYRLEKAIQRLDGVGQVQIKMEPVRAEVTPKAGAWVEAEHLRAAVKKAGFKPGTIQYVVRGQLSEWQGQPAVTVGGVNRMLLLQAEPKSPQAFQQARLLLQDDAKPVATVEGQWPEKEAKGAAAGTPTALRVRRVEVVP